MLPSQIILSAIILFIIYRTIVSYRRNNITILFAVIWLTFWFLILLLLFQQNILIFVAHALGIGRGVDLAIYLSIIIIFYLIFRIFIEINSVNKKITKIVRHEALKNRK